MADIQNLQRFTEEEKKKKLPNSVLANRLLSLDVRPYQLLDLLLGIFYAYKAQPNTVAHVSLYHFAQMLTFYTQGKFAGSVSRKMAWGGIHHIITKMPNPSAWHGVRTKKHRFSFLTLKKAMR